MIAADLHFEFRLQAQFTNDSDFLPLANPVDPSGAGKNLDCTGPTKLFYQIDLDEQRWHFVGAYTYAELGA